MTTANAELKSTVRNWITSRIRSTNDDYLASNDYVKFHRIEEEGATSGVYSTILKDTDTSGQIEFVDTLDEGEVKVIVFLDENNEVVPFRIEETDGLVESIPWSDEQEAICKGATIPNIIKGSYNGLIAEWKEEDPDNADKYERMKTITQYDVRGTGIDKSMKVVGLNMFNDAIQSLESAVSGTTNNLKDYIKFSSIEESTEEAGVYHTVLSNDKAAGQLEFVDTLDDAEQVRVIVCLNANNERCPMMNDNGEYVETLPLTEENESYARDLVNQAINGELNIEELKQADPENAEIYDRMATITHMEIQTSSANTDKKIKVVGSNMFNAAINSLESGITSLESGITTLNSSISSLTSSTTDTLKDYLKFSSIEESTEESGVYHTVLSNDKAAGQLEFIDTLDAGENVINSNPIYIILYDEESNTVDLSSYNISANWNTCAVYSAELKEELDFYLNSDRETDEFNDFLANSPNQDWISALVDNNVASYEVIYDGRSIIVYDIDNNPLQCSLRDYEQIVGNETKRTEHDYSDKLKELLDKLFSLDKSSEEYQSIIAKYPELEQATSYQIIGGNATPIDKKMKIVGKNMFDSSVGALTSRITELEQRLAILISAFETDEP